MSRRFLGSLLATALLAGSLPAVAEDIDLFVQPPGTAAGAPNVLILLDNTANWNTAFTNEIAALVASVNNLPVNADGTARFRVGLMLFTETGNPNNNIDGGYVRAAVRDFTSANKTKYMALLNSLNVTGDKSNGGKAGKTFSEAYQYYSGLAPYSGNSKVKTDYTGNVSGTAASNAIYALAGNALTTMAGSPYHGPIVSGSCAGNYIIYISNGAVQDNASDTSTATTQLANAAAAEGITGATTAIPISPSGSQSNVADEWARFMHQSSKKIVTYTVDVDKVTTGQGPGWSALLKSIAGVSTGKYFDVSSSTGGGAQISTALNEIFSEIQAVNSVFASVSLPVSVNTEGTYLNQVYIGMFRPDADGFPRWAGNLKQYKLGLINNVLKLEDADSAQAIDSSGQTGFISKCARSYWTPSTTDTYWTFRPQGGCLTVAGANNSNYPDGNVVEKGAQAYQLRSTTTRTVKTCSATFASCTTLTDFNNTNVTASNLGVVPTTDTATRDLLINWERGLDTDDENINGVTTTEMRPSAHGDVVHSRPIALNFGTDTSPKVVVFYGGNEGVLRAINGNRSTAINSVAAGKELWAFVPPEFYSSIKRLHDNSTEISFKGNITTSPTPLPKPYGIDGPISVYKAAGTPTATCNPGNTWIYPTMRRGGRIVYAFDATRMTDAASCTPAGPSGPTLKWKKGCPNLADDTNCTGGFSGLGQTWSAPKFMKTLGYGSGASPMLIMGGGYDNCEDADPNTCTSSSKGNHVYVMDADTGALLRTFDTDRGVVGDVFVVNDSSTGLAQWAYVVDLGGNIYRLSGSTANAPFGSTAPASWTMTRIASLGCNTVTTGCSPTNRKFMFAPDIVYSSGVYYLLVGSGDREKPLRDWASAYGVTNYFFVVQDAPSNTTWLSDETANCGSGVMCLNSLLAITSSANPTDSDLAAKKGWYLGLNTHEQVVTSAITVFGTTTFSTHTPTVPVSGSCTSNLGTARVYNLKFSNAAPANGNINRSQEIGGGGLPPSPVAGMVTLDNGQTVPFLIGGDPNSPLEGGQPSGASSGTQPKSLTYWYIHK